MIFEVPGKQSISEGLCNDGCPPCNICGIHMDAWWYYKLNGVCSTCSFALKREL